DQLRQVHRGLLLHARERRRERQRGRRVVRVIEDERITFVDRRRQPEPLRDAAEPIEDRLHARMRTLGHDDAHAARRLGQRADRQGDVSGARHQFRVRITRAVRVATAPATLTPEAFAWITLWIASSMSRWPSAGSVDTSSLACWTSES